MGYKYNVSCPETLLHKWTKTAVDCFLLGCNCSKCNIYSIYFAKSSYKCKMKDIVIELVRKFGTPKNEELGDENSL